MLELREHQIEGAKDVVAIIKERGSALLADVMGLGKTAVAISVLEQLNKTKILVVCPGGARTVWREQVSLFSENRKVIIVNTGKDKIAEDYSDSRVYAVSYELSHNPKILGQITKYMKWDMVIYDEAHYLSNLEARRTKSCLSNIWKIPCDKLFLTGSVQQNQTHDLYPLFARLAPEQFKSYGDFVETYCRTKETHWGLKVIGGKNLKKLNKITEKFMVRRTKIDDEMASPEREEIVEIIKIPGEESGNNEIAKIFFARGNSEFRDRRSQGQIAKKRKDFGLIKAPVIAEYMSNWRKENPDEPFVMFALHVEVADLLYELLGKTEKASIVTGQTKKEERESAVTDFQSGKTTAFIATFASAEAITLTRSSWLFFAEMSWSLSKVEQAAKRIERLGQKKKPKIVYLLTENLLDQIVYKSYKRKEREKYNTIG